MGNVKMVNTVGFGDGLLKYDSKRFKLIMYDVSCSANPVFLLPQKPIISNSNSITKARKV